MPNQTDILGGAIDDDLLDRLGESDDSGPDDRWAPTLAKLVEVLVARFRRNGLTKAEAGKLANATVLEIAHYFGGRMLYLPRGDRLKTALRDAEIYRRARRGNIPDLAVEFELTDIQVWRIIRQQRRLHLSKIQGRLFDEKNAGRPSKGQ